MNRSVLMILGLLLAAAMLSCGMDRPADPDGDNVLTLFALDTSGVQGVDWEPVPKATFKISAKNFIYNEVFEADNNGVAVIPDLPASTYTIVAEKIDQENNFIILGQKEKELIFNPEGLDTIFMNYQRSAPLVINEMYNVGCNASFYYGDQFLELYNSSNDTIWLDGYLVSRGTHISDIIDFEAVDYALAYLVYRFPGTRGETKICPIAPKQFVVLAADAIDHSTVGSKCVDLNDADYEFFYAMGNDRDNLDVPNLLPVNNYSDFSMSLLHEAVWISTGEEWSYGTHFDGNLEKEYIHIPLWTIIDGVEYARSIEYSRYLTVRVDAGVAGVGLTSYSARSTQRRFPGLDSNNSTFDFEINDPPTPGYQ